MMMPLSPQALSVFSCYAPQDADLREQFEKHLAVLKKSEWIHIWSYRDISAGAAWQQEIDDHLQAADLFFLFVSADFLDSEYYDGAQMQEILRRYKASEAMVIPILLRPVEWKQAPFGTLQTLPRNGRPVTSWRDRDKAFEQIAKEIGVVIERLRQSVVIVSCLPHQPFSDHLIRDLTNHRIPFWEAEAKQEPSILQEQIRGAAAVVVIASPETEYARMLKETERLLAIYQRPVMRVWVTDEGKDASRPPSRHEWIVVNPGQEQYAVQELRTTLQRRRFQGSAQPIHSPQEESALLQEPRNPYKGLDAFTAADAGDFFGRTALVDALVAMVKTTLSLEKKGQQPARLLALVGASGSGKSSVVQAGLLPALQAGKATQSEQWIYLHVIAPKTHPLDELALALLDLFPSKSLTMLRDDLKEGSARGLHLYATALARRTGAEHVVLVVDQFEEVFTLTEQEQERQQFLDLLVTACTQKDGPLIVILTLRADFYGHLMEYPALYKLIDDHHIPMLPMILSDLRAVITQPATLPDVHLTFEGNLVGDLLFEVHGQIGALPLLQFTLEQLVERRQGHLLTEHAYQQMGGIRGALTKHAEETYLALPSDAHRDLARTLFLRLLDPGTTEQETTRRRAILTEFAFPDERQTRLMQETIDAFVRARLLTITANQRIGTTTVKPHLRTTTADEKTGTTTIEVSHEALIREWPLLVDWLRTARDDIHLQQNISRAAAAWEQQRRSRDHLYQGSRLKEARAWAQRNTASQQEHAFLKASVARHLRALLIVIGVILLVVASSGIAGWYAFFQPQPTLVRTQRDDEIGSLRWCINNAPSGSTIMFAQNVRGLIKLTGDLVVGRGKQLTIVGPGANQLTISGGNLQAHIHVFKGATLRISDLSFKDSETVTNGFLYNEGSLTVTNSVISNNKTTANFTKISTRFSTGVGGGVVNGDGGTLAVINSTISDNTVKGGLGGGIYNSGTFTLTHSIVLHNTTDEGGGGIENYGGTLTITNSTVSNNRALGDPMPAFDGGIANTLQGTLTITNSTISDNMASGDNGGIGSDGTLTLINSTVSNNTASDNNGGIGSTSTLTLINSTISNNKAASGGGIFNYSNGHAALVFCTIVNNSATDRHWFDIVNQNSTSPMYLKASIVGANSTQDTSIAGAIISGGYNVIQRSSSLQLVGKTQSTDRLVVDLSHVLSPSPAPQNKDDPTQTYQLISSTNNPAYNVIPLDACTDADGHRVLTDQQGMPRPGKKKQNCDSGAYESQVAS